MDISAIPQAGSSKNSQSYFTVIPGVPEDFNREQLLAMMSHQSNVTALTLSRMILADGSTLRIGVARHSDKEGMFRLTSRKFLVAPGVSIRHNSLRESSKLAKLDGIPLYFLVTFPVPDNDACTSTTVIDFLSQFGSIKLVSMTTKKGKCTLKIKAPSSFSIRSLTTNLTFWIKAVNVSLVYEEPEFNSIHFVDELHYLTFNSEPVDLSQGLIELRAKPSGRLYKQSEPNNLCNTNPGAATTNISSITNKRILTSNTFNDELSDSEDDEPENLSCFYASCSGQNDGTLNYFNESSTKLVFSEFSIAAQNSSFSVFNKDDSNLFFRRRTEFGNNHYNKLVVQAGNPSSLANLAHSQVNLQSSSLLNLESSEISATENRLSAQLRSAGLYLDYNKKEVNQPQEAVLSNTDIRGGRVIQPESSPINSEPQASSQFSSAAELVTANINNNKTKAAKPKKQKTGVSNGKRKCGQHALAQDIKDRTMTALESQQSEQLGSALLQKLSPEFRDSSVINAKWIPVVLDVWFRFQQIKNQLKLEKEVEIAKKKQTSSELESTTE